MTTPTLAPNQRIGTYVTAFSYDSPGPILDRGPANAHSFAVVTKVLLEGPAGQEKPVRVLDERHIDWDSRQGHQTGRTNVGPFLPPEAGENRPVQDTFDRVSRWSDYDVKRFGPWEVKPERADQYWNQTSKLESFLESPDRPQWKAINPGPAGERLDSVIANGDVLNCLQAVSATDGTVTNAWTDYGDRGTLRAMQDMMNEGWLERGGSKNHAVWETVWQSMWTPERMEELGMEPHAPPSIDWKRSGYGF